MQNQTIHEYNFEKLLASYGLLLGILEENAERFEPLSVTVSGSSISFNEAMDMVVCSISDLPKQIT